MKNADKHQYNELFYAYIESGSRRSAQVVLPLVLAALKPASVLDVGCGAGAWLAVYRDLGLTTYLGVDGDYVQPDALRIAPDHFRPTDISQAFDLGQRFDLVQCLEVAEHVSADRAEILVDNLVRHGHVILFSAAVPGQGGENHINERPYGYWRDLFRARGYALYDFVRPRILDNRSVEPWYRYNMFLFIHRSMEEGLPREIVNSRLPDHEPIPDVAPFTYHLRRLVLRCLPSTLVSRFARLHHQISVQRAMRSGT